MVWRMQASGRGRGREALGLEFRFEMPDLKGARVRGPEGLGADFRLEIGDWRWRI